VCGLVVVIERGGPVDRARLDAGLALVGHRGPDARGTCFADVRNSQGDKLAETGFGHARLAILDPDPRSDQPFVRNDHLLAYNGEIYNHRDIGIGLPRETTGDTEALLGLLMRDGLAGLERANGMWAFCWLDPERCVLTAARDRYGKKPLFYLFDKTRLCIASEPMALLALAGLKPRPDTTRLDAFMAEGWLFPAADGSTHLEGVREVRPGHALELDIARWALSERRVCQLVTAPETSHPAGCDGGPATQAELAEILADAIRLRLLSDRKVALLLSGGIDSSLILSVLHARGWLDQVVCVTGDAGKSDDAAYARRCLDQIDVKGISLELEYGDASVDGFLDICARQAKPFPLIGNVLGMAALYRQMASEGVRVAIDGTGADEIFGGYWYRQAGFALRDALRSGDREWIGDIVAGGMLPDELRGLDHKHLISQPLPTPARDRLSVVDLALLRAESREGIANAASSDPLTGFGGSFHQALVADATAGRMQEWLWQNDRNAMAAGIENRSPFLDPRLARWMGSDRLGKFAGNMNKPELRALFAAFTPMPTSGRVEKQGFRWVYGRFLRGNAKAIRELLAGSAIVAGYLRPEALSTIFASGEAMAESRLIQRLIVLAGLEARGCLS
jgi:asparagine synthase (glutamine-hydrolysing)